MHEVLTIHGSSPSMIAMPRSQTLAVLIKVSIVGIAASWPTQIVCRILVPVATLFSCAQGREVLLHKSVPAVSLVGSFWVSYSYLVVMAGLAAPAFFTVALYIGAIAPLAAAAPLDPATRVIAITPLQKTPLPLLPS